MFKTITTIIKFVIITAVGISAIGGVIWLLDTLDWSLFAWVADEFATIDIDFESIFNYPNVWILASYFIGKGMIIFGLDLILHKITQKGVADE